MEERVVLQPNNLQPCPADGIVVHRMVYVGDCCGCESD
jgi:hypothetical protein